MNGTVFIIDGDAGVRKSLIATLGSSGYGTRAFASAEDFLDTCDSNTSGCVVAEVRMAGMGGLELQRTLAAREIGLPIIFMAEHGDVRTACTALKRGAIDFFEKPVSDELLLKSVDEALVLQSQSEQAAAEYRATSNRLRLLTSREQQILDRIVSCRHNGEIAAELGISIRTVEGYKSRIMGKLAVSGIPELMKTMARHGSYAVPLGQKHLKMDADRPATAEQHPAR